MHEQIQSLEVRLNRMERENRRLRWLLLGLPAIALLIGAQAQKAVWKGKTVVAEEFILADPDGKTRASLMMLKDGAHLVLQDQDGKARVRLAANPDGAGPLLYLYTKDEKAALAAGQSKDNGIGFVEFYDDGKIKGGVGGSALKK
jgi:hypothetical protein